MKTMLLLAILCLCAAVTAAAADDFPPGAVLSIQRAYARPDGSYSLRLADGSSAYAWVTANGYRVTFLHGRRGQIWTRTATGWRVTDLETAAAGNEARWDNARRQAAPKPRVRRIGSSR